MSPDEVIVRSGPKLFPPRDALRGPGRARKRPTSTARRRETMSAERRLLGRWLGAARRDRRTVRAPRRVGGRGLVAHGVGRCLLEPSVVVSCALALRRWGQACPERERVGASPRRKEQGAERWQTSNNHDRSRSYPPASDSLPRGKHRAANVKTPTSPSHPGKRGHRDLESDSARSQQRLYSGAAASAGARRSRGAETCSPPTDPRPEGGREGGGGLTEGVLQGRSARPQLPVVANHEDAALHVPSPGRWGRERAHVSRAPQQRLARVAAGLGRVDVHSSPRGREWSPFAVRGRLSGRHESRGAHVMHRRVRPKRRHPWVRHIALLRLP